MIQEHCDNSPSLTLGGTGRHLPDAVGNDGKNSGVFQESLPESQLVGVRPEVEQEEVLFLDSHKTLKMYVPVQVEGC